MISVRDTYNQLPYSRETSTWKGPVGRTPLEALLDELKKEVHWVASWQEIDGRLTTLLFTSEVLPDVILLDASYKINRYGMVLLQIGGTTPVNT